MQVPSSSLNVNKVVYEIEIYIIFIGNPYDIKQRLAEHWNVSRAWEIGNCCVNGYCKYCSISKRKQKHSHGTAMTCMDPPLVKF